MKKIIALLLSVVCVFSIVSCKDNGETDIIKAVNDKYAISAPTKIVTTSTHTIGNKTLNGTYTLVTGKIDGLIATVSEYSYEKFATVEEGAGDTETPFYTTVKGSKEFLENRGIRVDGGEWTDGFNFAPVAGDIAINITKDNVKDAKYENGVFTCVVANDKTVEVFGEGNAPAADVTVTVKDDGAVITGITLSYTIPATEDYPETVVVITTVYTYDLEQVTLVK